jgi:DNA-directed RNA polymerase specialized sigma24 family protein
MTSSLQSKALVLHDRLLAGDPRAPSETFELFEDQLSSVVRSTVPKLADPGDVNAAVSDALLQYFRRPAKYDPAKSTLLTWLCNQARYNALSQLREHGRRMAALDRVGEAVRIGLLGHDNDQDGEDQFLDAIEVKQIMTQYGHEIATEPGDQEVFLLMAAGTKDEGMFVEALGLKGTQAENRAEVRRRRDLIRKRLERLRPKLAKLIVQPESNPKRQ